MAKKVIFCNNNIKGQLHFRKEIMDSFEKDGWQVILIVPKFTHTEPIMNQLGKSWKLYEMDMEPNSINPIKDSTYLFDLLKIYRKEKPDIIFNYTIKPNIYSTIAAKIAGIKTVDMLAGLGYIFEGNSLHKKIGRRIYKTALKLADKVLVLNESNKKVLLNGNYVSPDKLLLLKGGEGVSLTRYPYKKMEFASVRFLMIARVLYSKGYQEYVEAARIVKSKYPEVEFELLGSIDHTSPARVPQEIIERDSKNGDIKYLGTTSDVPSFVLRDGVVLAIPSKYLEGLNRSLMEGAAMGRPIITTDNPGCRETVNDGINGFLVPASDSKTLAEAMIRFIELPADKKVEMAEASHRKAERDFNVSHVIDTYKRLVKELIRD
ncbi:MAG: glycosyltransferase family 4 protein [Muribaculaceae bacterium]|nr:glycosyltransferase family 4 protein [Muribaculaceae bacterium]